ncbi:uncharacterized protein BDZ99DRAFT_482353 [Mytilinidion resinicola]|uniref:Uncharacterized protein n=1 Tax=Mytilinidion resinicola TaxID=574789 RepID=A0A6A6Y3N1_9PEZI|nr:uncharacterized protein BDZ99DRAFT_482353 [Mytilinidion resinicola]KAF2803128.1 hypothetical protein BDZ99DRAFT_482353 [Mytilinidion resinicola]
METNTATPVFNAEKWIVIVRSSRDIVLIDSLYTEQVAREYSSVLDSNIAAAAYEMSLIVAIARHGFVHAVGSRVRHDEPFRSVVAMEEVDPETGRRVSSETVIKVMRKSELQSYNVDPELWAEEDEYRDFFDAVVNTSPSPPETFVVRG